MAHHSLLPYFVARQNALDMDRRGERPGALLFLFVRLPITIAALGFVGVVAWFVASFTLWKLDIG